MQAGSCSQFRQGLHYAFSLAATLRFSALITFFHIFIVKEVLIYFSCLGECCDAVKLQESFGIRNFFLSYWAFPLPVFVFSHRFCVSFVHYPCLFKSAFFPCSLSAFHPAFLCLFPGPYVFPVFPILLPMTVWTPFLCNCLAWWQNKTT